MSVLRNLESKLAGLVEGTFSRAFKSEVRPVEIARKLAKEMDEHKVQSLSRVYAPNEYAVWLSTEDRKQFEGYEDELARELSGYLLEHARREKITLVHEPADRVQDRRAAAARRVRHPGPAASSRRRASTSRRARATRATRWSTRPPSAFASRCASPIRAAAAPGCASEGARARSSARAARCSAARATATSCSTIANVSRHHAEVRPSGGSWIVNDLGSTNGIKVNGRRVDGPQSLRRGRRDRAGHLAGDLRAGVADGARSDRRGSQVRLPGRAVPVPALGRALAR